MNIDAEIEKRLSQIATLRDAVKWLRRNRAKLEAVPVQGSFCGDVLDFDRLNHAEVIQVIKTLGGKWKKNQSAQAGKIDYVGALNGTPVRCWAGEPPPSCRLIEVEEIIPAQPERVVKKFKMVCEPQLAVQIAKAQERAAQAQPEVTQ